MFGYSIALGGLIYYKIGAEQAQAAYMKLTGDQNSTFNRFRRSLWAKVGAGVLMIFVVLAMAHGLSAGSGIDTSRSSTGLTGVPDPEMVDAYNSESDGPYGGEAHGLESWDRVETPTHYSTDVMDEFPSSHPLDVVIYISPSPGNNTLSAFEDILSQPSLLSLNPRVIAYGDATSFTSVTREIPLGRISSPAAAYMDHIASNYDGLADHTIFLHTDVDIHHLPAIIASKFTSFTGVAELSQGEYSVCGCLECVDSTHTPLTRTEELYALTHEDVCSSTQSLLVYLTLK
jgi:hypothetical protein